jgi:hypothetical protein
MRRNGQSNGPGNGPNIITSAARAGRDRMLRLFVVAGFGLMLAACDKCSVPTWQHSEAGKVPLSCHSDAPRTQ